MKRDYIRNTMSQRNARGALGALPHPSEKNEIIIKPQSKWHMSKHETLTYKHIIHRLESTCKVPLVFVYCRCLLIFYTHDVGVGLAL